MEIPILPFSVIPIFLFIPDIFIKVSASFFYSLVVGNVHFLFLFYLWLLQIFLFINFIKSKHLCL